MALEYVIAPVEHDDKSYSLKCFIPFASLDYREIKSILKNVDAEEFEFRLQDLNNPRSGMINVEDFLCVLYDNKKMFKKYSKYIKLTYHYKNSLKTYNQILGMFINMYKIKDYKLMKTVSEMSDMYKRIYDRLWHCDSYTDDELVRVISRELVANIVN